MRAGEEEGEMRVGEEEEEEEGEKDAKEGQTICPIRHRRRRHHWW